MSDLKIKGKISHYPGRDGVVFNFNKTLKTNKDGEIISSEYDASLPFEIWKKFKDSEVEIIVKKSK